VIPVLIVPILNQPELLDAMLGSIDHPVDRIVIIDNGDVLDAGWLTRNPQYRVIQPGHNLGVAASWNLGMKATPQAPWWLIVNHDIAFGPGDLAHLEEVVNPGAAAIYYMLGMASFAITRHTVNVIGLFDEGFVNGYDEDLDYARRADLAGLPRFEAGFTGTHAGSATIMADPALRAWNGLSHSANDHYYAQKWGGSKQGGETFDTPFDRGGHLGDWRFDYERYRNQTWPRKG
jgi:GT2 family glycosyltransferase